MSQLCEQLLTVIHETMQPEHVSLWLRKPIRSASSPLQNSKDALEEVKVIDYESNAEPNDHSYMITF